MPTPNSASVAPHLRESVFRDYEALIKRAVDSWPAETSTTVPPGVAPSTFIANFRNAILSLKNYKWETSVDVVKLWQMAVENEYVINQDATGAVWFRKRLPRGRPNMLTAEATVHSRVALDNGIPPPSVVPWRDATQEEIEALCLLLTTKRLTGPFGIVGRVPDGLDLTFDVGVVFHEDKNLTIIT